MWPFRRKTIEKKTELPKEVTDYYQAERRDRVGLAWLLGFATLIGTVLIVLGLFFAGRWAYRKLANKDNQNQPTATQTEQTGSSSSEQSSNNNESSSNSNQPEQSSGQSNQTATSSTNTNSSSTTSGSSSSSSSTSSSAESSNLPDTGPGNIAEVFVITAAVSGTVHYLITKKQRV